MRTGMLVAMLIPLLLLVGCAKPTVKKNEPAKDETANAEPKPEPEPAKPTAAPVKNDEPNWLTDPRFQKDKTEKSEPVGPSKPPGAVTAPQGGWDNPNAQAAKPPVGAQKPEPVPQPQPMGVLKPEPVPQLAAQPAANPAPVSAPKFSPVTQQDMKEVWIYVENRSLASGSMPTRAEILSALLTAKAESAKLVGDGSIILTNSKQRESVWAYEAKAMLQGGLIVNQNGVETVTAEQLKTMLGK